ncbi:unnamed protein product [Rotaria magnacalcarata]|uniref:Uncharacterized protein n=1 Tax=Rotaria magnacalcarata TaxID=392030 RepID=A0A8S2TKU1_9BILA|nr:unnamed protein product [Rotaria magnacalcarata]
MSIVITKQDLFEFQHAYGSSILAYQLSNINLTVFLICRDDDEDTTTSYQYDTTTYSRHIQSRCCCPGICSYSNHTISPVGLFWTLFSFVYLINRLIIRLLSNLKCFHRNTQSATTTKSKFSQAFVISLNQYGSTRPIQSIYRSDSLFSNGDLTLDNEQISAISNYGKINLTINHYSAMIDNCQQPKTCLLKHYLKTYNPLEIDLIEANPETIRTSKVTEISGDDRSSDTSTLPADNCYSMNCTNKQKIHQSKRYVRLKEQENCSANVSIIDDQPSSCSTRLTSSVLPVVMVTDCSNSQRLHTDIIEMNENE